MPSKCHQVISNTFSMANSIKTKNKRSSKTILRRNSTSKDGHILTKYDLNNTWIRNKCQLRFLQQDSQMLLIKIQVMTSHQSMEKQCIMFSTLTWTKYSPLTRLRQFKIVPLVDSLISIWHQKIIWIKILIWTIFTYGLKICPSFSKFSQILLRTQVK